MTQHARAKTHTTNYLNTFLEVAEDCVVPEGCPPPEKEPRTAARRAYDLLRFDPYRYTSDEVLYQTSGQRDGVSREEFFSRAQPCFRSSALCKRYGWGVHYDHEGKMALIARESPQYARLQRDESIQHISAMRSSKKR